jgi:4-amino-4-deoxy-L-arabinose transferase-like glycosyltransferase
MSEIRKRVPAPLGWLLAAVAALGIGWALLTPAWQAPDENSHFAYLQSLGERFALPGDPDRNIYSTEQGTAILALNADQVAGVLLTKPNWSERAYERWKRLDERMPDRLREDGGGPNPATSNPPLYYLYASGAYRVAAGGDIFDRILTVRIASLVWPLVVVIAVWLLAGELFARDRLLQLAAAGFAGLLPMVSFISASINPDGMLYATWAVFLWLGVRALRHGLDAPTAAALALVTGAALVVKATSYALLPALGLVLAVGLWRLRHGARLRLAVLLGWTALGLAVTVGVWTVIARSLNRAASGQLVGTGGGSTFDVREAASYLWQFYLPKLPFQTDFPSSTDWPVYDIFVKGATGAFGWLEVMFPAPVFVAAAALAVVTAAAAAVALWRTRRTIDVPIALFFLLAAGTLLAGLHWTEYHFILSGNVNFMQGRYLFPLLGIGGVALAKALTLVPPARRATAVATVLGLLVALQLYGLGLVLQRYYA